MIKFFRRIRYELMEKSLPATEGSNKLTDKRGKPAMPVGRYMKYAIGEVALVVIGILIALQINNWNENSKNKRLETNYLISISKDLDNDLLEFDDAVELAKERNNRVLFLQEAIENPELVLDSSEYFVQSIVTAGYTYIPVISNHSFEELKSSGRLTLIQNKELRVLIAKYYDFVLGNSQWDFISQDIQLKYVEFSRGILNQEQLNWVTSDYYSSDSLFTISEKELNGIFQNYLSKNELQSILPQVFKVKYDAMQVMHLSKERADYLKNEILREVNGHSN